MYVGIIANSKEENLPAIDEQVFVAWHEFIECEPTGCAFGNDLATMWIVTFSWGILTSSKVRWNYYLRRIGYTQIYMKTCPFSRLPSHIVL
jgi:cytochrome b